MEYFKLRKEIVDNIRNAITILSNEGVIDSHHKKLYRKKFFYPRSYINKLLEEIEEYKNDDEYLSFKDTHTCNNHIIFGYSQMRKPLDAYVINDTLDYNKTILITGVMHGFEGAYPHDGMKIYDTLKRTAFYYSNNNDILGKTRIVIVPCCNPDGLFDGISNKGFGRKTAKNIDINRDFDNYSAIETLEIIDLMIKYKPDVYIDVHGWLNAVYGDAAVLTPFYNNCLIERKYPNQFGHGKGYAISYVKNNIKTITSAKPRCALVEFNSPDEISPKKMVMALNELLGLEPEYKFVDEQTKKITKGYCDVTRLDKGIVKKIIGRK